MRKSQFVSELALETGLTTKQAAKATDAVFDKITRILESGGEVKFKNFGTFKRVTKAGITYRNVYANEPVYVPERYAPKIQFSSRVKTRVKRGK